MPRMRTIDQAHAYILSQDPDTALTKYALRQKVLRGEIPHARAGNKYLLDIDQLTDHLSRPAPIVEAIPARGFIRPIAL